MAYHEIITYNEPMGIGITKPLHVTAQNNQSYVIKTYDDNVQNKPVINEYISYKIAEKLSLPIPPAQILRLPQELILSTPELKKRGIKSNLVFGSKFIKTGTASINPFVLKHAQNKKQFSDILFFDHILFNNDRGHNFGNIIYDDKNHQLLILDHSHIFELGELWDSNTLKNLYTKWILPTFHDPVYKLLLKYINGNSPFYRVISKLEKNITLEFLDEIIDSVPDEWHLSKKDAKAAKDLLIFKITNSLHIAKEIQEVWPDIKGY